MINVCAIDGCSKLAYLRGWCSPHYQRWRRHGDPLGGGSYRPPQGEIDRFYREVLLTDERGPDDECLIWPYCRNGAGYAQKVFDGEKQFVHRRLCEEVHGPAPTPEHQAAHSCGRGHLACVTKGHLDWKTRPENEADKLTHGTDPRGERCGTSKITEATAREILALKGKMPIEAIGKRFGVSGGHVNNIHLRKRWAWL